MKPVLFALTTLLLIGSGCNADRPTSSASGGAQQPAPTAPPDASQSPSATMPPAPAPGPNDTVPADFRGHWAANDAACRKPADESQLDLQANRAAFFEGSGPIKSVVVDGDVITLVAEISAEGAVDETTYAFRLSDDGKTLTDISTGPGMVRHRC